MEKTIEFFINNKLFKNCPYKKWTETFNSIKTLIKKKGYEEVYSGSFCNRIHCDAKIYVNIETFKCIIVNYRINTGYKDKKGNNIYEDDKVNTTYGFISTVNGHWDWKFNKKHPTPYYVRKSNESSWGWNDYDVENFADYEKVEDQMGLPKKHWNTPDTITAKEF